MYVSFLIFTITARSWTTNQLPAFLLVSFLSALIGYCLLVRAGLCARKQDLSTIVAAKIPIVGYGALSSKVLNPRPGRGVDAPPPPSFFAMHAEMCRIVLKFCIAYGASRAQLLVKKKLTGSCQVTELWRHKRYKVRPFLREIAEYCI